MPTLLQINVASNKGSTGKIAENIGLTAMKEGWKSYIFHGVRYAGKTKLNDISTNSSLSEFFHYIISLLFDAHGRASFLSTRRLIKKIKKIKPDIIHLHNIHGYYINYNVLFGALQKLNIPVLWTLHDCWSFTGHCVYFDRIGCSKWKSQCQLCAQSCSYPKSILDFSKRNFLHKKKIFTSINNLTIIPVSFWLSGLVNDSFLSSYNRYVIHNGIDLSIFKPTESILRSKLGLSNKKVILGVDDGYGVRKGLDDFIHLSLYLGADFQIILIGVTESDKSKISNSIIALDRTSNQKELVEYYSMADVYVNPTYEDNFPTTNIEALACGTPVVTYNTGGSPEAIDSITGIIINKGDIRALSNAVIKICGEDRECFRVKCRSRAERMFDMNARYNEYIKLYNSLI